VTTKLVSQRRRGEIVERVRKIAAAGQQVYWVCPLIEESEKLELQTAVALHAELTGALSEFKVGLLHGRMKPAEKAAAMDGFVRGEVNVLVATTVIEVGVDVPNASLMVIEHAGALRPRATAPAARARRPSAPTRASACCFSRSRCRCSRRRGSRSSMKTTTASRSPGRTCRSAALASFSGRGSPACPCCALPTWSATSR
jgi:hypothetical protein